MQAGVAFFHSELVPMQLKIQIIGHNVESMTLVDKTILQLTEEWVKQKNQEITTSLPEFKAYIDGGILPKRQFMRLVNNLSDQIPSEKKSDFQLNNLTLACDHYEELVTIVELNNFFIRISKKFSFSGFSQAEICQRIDNQNIFEIFEFLEKLTLRAQKMFIDIFFSHLTKIQLQSCLNLPPEKMKPYKEISKMISASKGDKFNVFFEILTQDLASKARKEEYQKSCILREIYESIFLNCQPVLRLSNALAEWSNTKSLFFVDSLVQILYKRNMLSSYLIPHFEEWLLKCSQPESYLAIRKFLAHEKQYVHFLESLTNDTVINGLKKCSRQGFKAPPPELQDIQLRSQFVDNHGTIFSLSIYRIKTVLKSELIYELRASENTLLGEISLRSFDGNLHIDHIETPIKNIKMRLQALKALYEFAFTESFHQNLGGSLILDYNASPNAAEDFYFGFRATHPELSNRYRFSHKTWKLEYMILRYYGSKNEDLIKEIEDHEKTLNENDLDWQFLNAFKVTARRNLGREFVSLEEALDHGCNWNQDTYMQSIVDCDPYLHHELGPLFSDFLEAREKRDLKKQDELRIKNHKYHEFYKKIYHEMRIVNFKIMTGNEFEEVFAFTSERMRNPIKRCKGSGDTKLSDQKIQEWKKEYNL